MGDNVNEEIEYVYDNSEDLLTQCIINQLNIVKDKQEAKEETKEEIDKIVKLYNLKNEADKIEVSRQQKNHADDLDKKKYNLEKTKVDNEATKEARNSRDRLIGIGVDVSVALLTTVIGFVFYSKLDNRHLMYDKDGVLISRDTQNILGKSLPSLFKKK